MGGREKRRGIGNCGDATRHTSVRGGTWMGRGIRKNMTGRGGRKEGTTTAYWPRQEVRRE